MICISYLAYAVAGSSAVLPDPLRALAKSSDAFADAIAKLNQETDAIISDAKLIHDVSANKTARAQLLDDMSRTLTQGMPSASAYDGAETAALKAAAVYKTADLAAKQAELKLEHRHAELGNANLTTAEENELRSLRKTADDEKSERASAKADLQATAAKAEEASTALLEATRAHVRRFEERVDELMHAARTHEAKAKNAMREAISEGRTAADAEYRSRKMGEQTAEETRGLAEEWAEAHEDAIEDASDHASDDLERIYDPVKELARHTLEVAERNDAMHRVHVQRMLESKKRVELVQVLRGEQSSSRETSWSLWAGSAGAAAAGVLLVAISRRRMGTGLQQPLLG
jgi:hypothetical protein